MRNPATETFARLRCAIAATLLGIHASPLTAAPQRGPDGNMYEVILTGEAISWAEAAAEASASGNTLATLRSEAVDVFVETLRQQALSDAGIDPSDPAAPPLWVGGSQAAGAAQPTEGWAWQGGDGPIPGSHVDPGYSNWLQGEPNDWPTPVEDEEEDFLAIGFQGQFGWNDRSEPCSGYVVMQRVVLTHSSSGAVRNPDNGNWYEFVLSSGGITWDEADRAARCRATRGRTGRLVTIDSAAEAAFLESHRADAVATQGFNPAEPSTHPPLWIGGKQSGAATSPGAGWTWVDGTAVGLGHSDWSPGQPDDAPGAGVEDGEENRLALGRAGLGWSDEPGGTFLVGYIVEYEDPITTELALRSTCYDAESGGYQHSYRPGHTRNIEMTIEAWVFREAGGQHFQTVLSQGFTNSYWFGFAGNKLRFYRSGGSRADSAGVVPTGQWSHVAVSYHESGSPGMGFARFYIDGVSAGEHGLANSGTGTADDLLIGRDPLGFDFKGCIDELRLWSTTRSGAQIRADTCRELQSASGLEAAWPAGGRVETISGGSGSVVANAGSNSPTLTRRGILPKELVVPLAAQDPTFDGNVDETTEYAGAEQIVLRYADGPDYRDAVAHLVYTKDYLYVGIEGARLPISGTPSANNAVTAYLDLDGNTDAFDPELVQGNLFLSDALSGFSRVKQVTIGTTTTHVWSSTPSPPAHAFGSRQGTDFRGEVTATADIEFRFHRSLIGDLDPYALHRLALSHIDNGGPNGDRWAPAGGDGNDAATWTPLRYHPYSDATLPRVNAFGRVIDEPSNSGVAGVPVTLRGTGVVYANTVTASDGSYSFSDVPVGRGTLLEISIEPPEGSLLGAASAVGPRAPDSLGSTVARWNEGCGGGQCTLAAVTFRITTPRGATSLGSFSPAQVWPPVIVRDGPTPDRVVPSTVRVEGTNLHSLLDFHFARTHCPIDLTLCDPADYYPASATFVPAAADGSDVAHVLVVVPDIPETRYGFMRLTAHDRWHRPANPDVLGSGSWMNFPTQISVGPPPYELLHGFAFQNDSDGHDLDDYRAAFHDQICDPRYMVGFWAFSPIYLSIFGNGECVGMAVTAQQFARGRRAVAPLNPDVRYGNGFISLRTFEGKDLAIRPATFDVSNPCSPAPTNAWAAIKANHGVQASSEFIGATLEQFDFTAGSDMIDIGAQLDKIRANPGEWVLCLRNGARGHCVQPLRVIDTAVPDLKRIEVWDNNFPEQRMTITVDLALNGYIYNGLTNPAVLDDTGAVITPATPWSGNWLLVYRVDPIYDNNRHVPSIDTAGHALFRFGVTHLWDLLQMIVSGDAEPLVTAGDGSQTGWDAAGNFLANSDQTIAIPSFNWIPNDTPPLGHHPVSMHHRTDLGAPQVEIFNRGNDYKIHNSHHGTMFQMFVADGIVGASDQLIFTESDGRVLGQRFEAGLGGRDVETRIALCKNASEYPGALSMGSVRVPEGGSIGVETLPDGSGMRIHNDTGADISPNFNIVAATLGAEPAFFDSDPLLFIDASTLTVSSPDGLNYRDLIFEIDHDRDGTPEESWQFESASSTFVPYVAPPEPSLRFGISEQGNEVIVLIHPDGLDDWEIQSTATLAADEWKALEPGSFVTDVVDGEVFTYIFRRSARAFYRYARKDEN